MNDPMLNAIVSHWELAGVWLICVVVGCWGYVGWRSGERPQGWIPFLLGMIGHVDCLIRVLREVAQ